MKEDILKDYLHQDRLGSTTNLTDQFGRVVGRADYNEWGEITYREALDITSSYRRIYPQSSYTGHDWDDVLGMYYAKARFYSAEDKRFVAVDPIKGNITQPLSLVSYVYCVDNPLRWVDPLGLRNKIPAFLLDGILAHIAIEIFISSEYRSQAVYTNVYIQKYALSISKRGYADVIIRKQNFIGKNYFEVYEIKPKAVYDNDWRKRLAHAQVQGYVTAINNNKENSTYQKAKLGVSILDEINGKKLPMPGDKGRYILIHTYSKYFDDEDGMIYYEILDCPAEEVEYDYTFTKDDEKKWQNYLNNFDYENTPTYALTADSENDLDYDAWLSNIEVDYHFTDWGFGLFTFTKITYPDGIEKYRLDGLKGMVTPAFLDHADCVEIYQMSPMSNRTWFNSPGEAFMMELGHLPLAPSGSFVPVPVF